MNRRNLYRKLLAGSVNMQFSEFVRVVQGFGFRRAWLSGSHHIYVRRGVRELLNLHDVQGKAKPHQVRQFLDLVQTYSLVMEDSK